MKRVQLPSLPILKPAPFITALTSRRHTFVNVHCISIRNCSMLQNLYARYVNTQVFNG